MFLPVDTNDLKARGWDCVDFVYVSGDAYVDHPSFGAAIITRVLEDEGFRVGVIAQPDWRNLTDIQRFGRPKLGFMVSAGNIDSMVAHYTAAKRKRSDDAYSPGGKNGRRPDRAVEVYCSLIRRAYGDVPVIIGGLEASLRRFAHYDYWDDCVRPSILVSSGADLLTYGMGENQTREIARRLAAGEPVSSLTDIRGTCYLTDVRNTPYGGVECPSFDNVSSSLKEYAVAAKIQQDEHDYVRGRMVKQKHGKQMLVQNVPMPPLTTPELDRVYELPYERNYHPMYEKDGGVPAIQEVRFSVTHNRGCFGACNFCSLAFHQGRFITARSHESVLREIEMLTHFPDFKGYIHDVGGPTANFRQPSCEKQKKLGLCKGKKCLAPTPCPNLAVDHSDYLALLRAARQIPGVKKVFIRSGIRYDYLLQDRDDEFFRELVEHHISGQLKVAPEHCSAAVLDKMGKPHIEAYIRFSQKYFQLTGSAGKEQYLVPYLMSSHPGSGLDEAVELALFLKKNRIRPEQVQDFYPTPGTVSTAMFYTGLDPYTMQPVYAAKDPHEKALQRALLQYFDPKKHALAEEALIRAHRRDLIGFGPECLIRPSPEYQRRQAAKQKPSPESRKGKSGKHPARKGAAYGGKKEKR